MALRNIVTKGDEILSKKCREVEEINQRIIYILEDMIETMREKEGVGIAAPQVGILRKLCIIEPEPGKVMEFINPKLIEESGEQEGYEGCLSVPGYIGLVKRPQTVKVEALNRTGQKVIVELEGFDAVVACHEIDHLNGVLFTEKATDIHRPEEESRDK